MARRQGLVRALGHATLLVQEREDAHRLRLDQVDDALVVREVREVAADAFLLIELHLDFEDEMVEHLLQPFIGEVDAKLFEGVHLNALSFKWIHLDPNGLEVFEAKDVKHSDEG